jgi:hypothetical protein
MHEVARGNAIDVGQTSIRAASQIEARQQLEQTIMGLICGRDRQRFFIESLDVAANQIAQQLVQTPLLGFVPAQFFEFLLEIPEGPQPVMLVRKPGIKIVHIGLFR